MLTALSETARLAGYFAAHGIWCVSDGETLIPMLAYDNADGTGGMDRYAFDDLADGVRAAQEQLEEGQDGWLRAVLVADAYVNLETGRTDALLIDAVEYGPFRQSIKIAVPYRPQPSPGGFAVHRPKFFEVSGVDQSVCSVSSELGESFFAGVYSHEEAAVVWDAHLDESV